MLAIILKYLPKLQGVLAIAIAMYNRWKRASQEKENGAAVREAVDEKDQRDLEKALGGSVAGKPVDMAGSVIRDALPGVRNDSHKKD
jgi:hypothetical protein